MSADYKPEKKIIQGEILENICLADGICQMVIAGEEIGQWFAKAEAGQFVNIYLDNAARLLPRPISICRIEGKRLTIVFKEVGKGTRELAEKKAGSRIRLSTPLGNGYEGVFRPARDILLVAGGVGVPPMLELAIRLKNQGRNVTAIVGFTEESFLVGELQAICDKVYVCTENGSEGYKGNVLQLIRETSQAAEQCFACGPKAMLRLLNDYCIEHHIELVVSLEERMGCGYGACVGCSVKLRHSAEPGSPDQRDEIFKKKVCKDGPVFYAREVVWDE